VGTEVPGDAIGIRYAGRITVPCGSWHHCGGKDDNLSLSGLLVLAKGCGFPYLNAEL